LATPPVEHVKAVIWIKAPHPMFGVVPVALGNRIVRGDVDIDAIGLLGVALEPGALEEGAFLRCRVLQVERRPLARIGVVPDALEGVAVVALNPWRIVYQRRQENDFPL